MYTTLINIFVPPFNTITMSNMFPKLAELMNRPALDGLSPVLYRNWLVGRYLQQRQALAADLEVFYRQANTALEKTPMRGQARLLTRFYNTFPERHELRAELHWGHYRALLDAPEEEARDFYLRCAIASHWTAAQLNRQITTAWHRRRPDAIDLDSTPQHPFAWLPKPVVLEFVAAEKIENEQVLEEAILDQLGAFLLELGQELAFVARQQRISSFSGKQFAVDLVFYHYRLRRFVLIELKTGELTPADIGQLDTYVRLYDELMKKEDDAPTLGLILCRRIDPAFEQYTALQNAERLMAATFLLRLSEQPNNRKKKSRA